MKKIIISLIIALTLFLASPVMATSITLGSNNCRIDSCVVWREGMPLGNYNYCERKTGDESTRRLYELEKVVIELQGKIDQYQNQADRINNLEQENIALKNRVGIVEGLFNQLRALLIQVITMLSTLKR